MSDPTPDGRPQYPSYPGDGPPPPAAPLPGQAYPPPAAPLPGQAPPGPGWVPRHPEPTDRLGLAALACAGLVTLSFVVSAALAFPARDTYIEAADAGTDALDVMTAYDYFGFVFFPVALAAFVVTSLWLYRMRSNVDLLRPEIHHARSKGWAWGGWVCPVVSLWFPFQFVRDLLRRHVGSRSTPAVVRWWWAGFLLTFTMSQIGSELVPLEGEIDRSTVQAIPVLESVSAGIALVSLVLWARVVRRLRNDQRELLGAARV